MFQIIFAALFGYAVGMVGYQALTGRKVSAGAFASSFAYLVVVGGLAGYNFEAELFAQKVASEYAFRQLETSEHVTFAVQAAANAVPFLLTGAWWAAIGTNIAAVAVLKAYLFDEHRRLSLIMWAPAVVNFGLFALRDPLIGVCVFGLTMIICRPPTRLAGRVVEIVLILVSASLRPESIVIYLVSRFAGMRERMREHPWLIIALPGLILGLVYALTYVPVLLGLPSQTGIGQLPDLLQSFFIARADRNPTGFDTGGGNILGGALTSMPFIVRYPIQIFTFFVLPLPFEVRSVTLLLAMLDSVVFIALTVAFWRRAPAPAKRFFTVYVLAVSFFAANYGNVFRLRLPAYFIIAAGLVVAHQMERRRAEGRGDADRLGESSPGSRAI